ncbi:MAG: hypothetical protein QF769_07385 [Candidatus Marinimicrobia bacterium]|jgi:hypothetical protein|nr:hypothetical protein [Candidatus Neomarinimicrobiota bacterium]
MNRKFIFLFSLLILGCDVDEDPPDNPTDLRGFFTLANENPRIQLTWEGSISPDVSEYHIFRAIGIEGNFDSLTTVNPSVLAYSDTNVAWQESFGYKIRAKDQSTNIGEFSDSLFIKCYKPVGQWAFPNYDSLSICIDPIIYDIPSNFQLDVGDSLMGLGDTVGTMTFSESILDSIEWIGNGWMVFNYTTLELNNNQEYETITANKLPEYYQIELLDPDSGIIFFLSGKYESIELVQTVKDCDGIPYFP